MRQLFIFLYKLANIFDKTPRSLQVDKVIIEANAVVLGRLQKRIVCKAQISQILTGKVRQCADNLVEEAW